MAVVFILCFTLCPFERKMGSMLVFGLGIGQVIFVPEWPKGEFVSFCIGCILLTKSLSCNIATLTRMPYILESSDIQRLFLQYEKGLNMTSISVTNIKKAIFGL